MEHRKKTKNNSTQQGLNSKPFWNIARQMKRNSSEDLTAIKHDKGNILFSDVEIKLHTISYYKGLYTKRDSANYNQQCTNFINKQVKKYLTDNTSNQEEYLMK